MFYSLCIQHPRPLQRLWLSPLPPSNDRLILPQTYATLQRFVSHSLMACYRAERKMMQAPSAQYHRFLGTYLAPQRTRMAILATLMLIDLALQLGLPRVVQTFIDSATTGVELRTLLWIGVAYLAVAISQNWT